MSPRGQIIIWLLNGTNESSCQPFSSVWALSPSTEQMSGHYLKRSSAWVNFWSAEWAVILEISFLGYHVGRQGESQLLWETIPLNTAIGCMSEGYSCVGNLQSSSTRQQQWGCKCGIDKWEGNKATVEVQWSVMAFLTRKKKALCKCRNLELCLCIPAF